MQCPLEKEQTGPAYTLGLKEDPDSFCKGKRERKKRVLERARKGKLGERVELKEGEIKWSKGYVPLSHLLEELQLL